MVALFKSSFERRAFTFYIDFLTANIFCLTKGVPIMGSFYSLNGIIAF